MPLLRDVRPEELLRAGAVLGRVADEVGTCITQARRSADVSWTGRPNERYQLRLAGLARDLSRVQRAYDDACDALLRYSREIGPARDLALQADLIEAECDDLARARVLIPGTSVAAPMTPYEMDRRARAQGLRRAAADQEERASAALVAVLLNLADDAPHLSGWTSVSHTVADVARGAGDQVSGTASLGRDAFLSVPWVGDAASRTAARRRLWEQAAAMTQPWLAIEDLLRELDEGQWAHAGGSFGAALVLRRAGARGRRVELFGAHDDLPLGVLGALRRGGHGDDLAAAERWVTQHAQQEFLEAVLRLRQVPLPTLGELLDGGVDLLHQEAHGGHTILKHVGRDPDFLRRRQEAEPGPEGPAPMSSFVDLDAAESAVAAALNAHRVVVERWLAGTRPRTQLRLEVPSLQGVLVDPAGRVATHGAVIVRLVRVAKQSFRVETAFLGAAS
ncbi:MAG: RNase A-like domain-containing protein [Mycobacteriales bacterium]